MARYPASHGNTLKPARINIKSASTALMTNVGDTFLLFWKNNFGLGNQGLYGLSEWSISVPHKTSRLARIVLQLLTACSCVLLLLFCKLVETNSARSGLKYHYSISCKCLKKHNFDRRFLQFVQVFHIANKRGREKRQKWAIQDEIQQIQEASEPQQ